MSNRRRLVVGIHLAAGVGALAACSGDSSVTPVERYTVGGSVTGLQDGIVVLRNNVSDELSLGSNGSFSFPTSLPGGTGYSVVVASHPEGQRCEVLQGTGTIADADVRSVVVECRRTTFTVGGTVAGLTAGELVLNNGSDELSISGNGSFTFPTRLETGTPYSVEVASQPAGQVCTVTGGAGTIGEADITSVSVACAAQLFSVGGSVAGLGGGSLTIRNNGTDDLVLTSDGAFSFPTMLPGGAAYDVTVAVQPADQQCLIEKGSGVVDGADVTDVSVTCGDLYSIGGTVTGLGSSPLVLQNNGADDLSIEVNGSFTFSEGLPDGAPYSVAVASEPANRTCTVDAGSGVIAGADATDVQVSCSVAPLTNKIVFHSDRDGDYEIYRTNQNGTSVTQLTDNDVDDLWPVISPDGTRIAFWTARDGNQEIYVMDVDGANPTRVTQSGAADRQPAWSPDGQRIAFHRVVSGQREIYTIQADGTGINRLTNNSFDDEEPAWSPDGSLIAFMTNRDGDNEIYVMNASNGSGQINLTNSPGRDGKPDWSPDGSRILFDRNDTSIDAGWLGDAEIMCMNADGSGQVRLTTDTDAYVDTQPRWSGTGDRLVFNSTRDTGGTNPQLYVARVNDCAGLTDVTRLTNSSARDAAGDWSP